MAHFFLLPTNENGLITDADILTTDLPTALEAPFNFSDIFLYSHGWCTNATGAMQSYNKFGIGFAKTILQGLAQTDTPMPAHLAVGIHWPSLLSENQTSFVNFFEPLSYYSMEKRADAVGQHAGYSFLRTLLENNKTLQRINLIGHSFGCKVVLSTLQEVIKDSISTDLPVNVVLLEAACDDDDLAPGDIYGDVIGGFPNLRMLVTMSQQDTALQKYYPLAGRINLFHADDRQALGAVGPADAVKALFSGNIGQINVAPGFDPTVSAVLANLKKKFVVADLSAIHKYRNTAIPPNNPLYKADSWGGSHSDIFFGELYALIAKFLY